jgi:bacillaene synthase trans-acting acyltransferase
MNLEISKTIFMFSGQGAQYYHMGAELYASEKVFREQMDTMNSMVVDRLGCSVLASMYASERRKTQPFQDTVLSNLGIFMVEHALTETLAHYGCRPDAVLGASMGALAAICATGAVAHQEMLEAAIRQALALERTCLEGAMLAILAPPALYEHNVDLAENSEVAAVNSASHFVIALPRWELHRVEAFLTSRKVAFQRLPVSRAYHSRWIDPARAGFFAASEQLSFARGRIPVNLCSVAPSVFLASTEALWNAIRQPIRLSEAIRHFEKDGPYRYIDVGPSGTLATLLKYALPGHSRSRVDAILTPLGYDQKNLQTFLIALGTRH